MILNIEQSMQVPVLLYTVFHVKLPMKSHAADHNEN